MPKSEKLKAIESERVWTMTNAWNWFERYTEEFHRCFPNCWECKYYLSVTRYCTRLKTKMKPNDLCEKGER